MHPIKTLIEKALKTRSATEPGIEIKPTELTTGEGRRCAQGWLIHESNRREFEIKKNRRQEQPAHWKVAIISVFLIKTIVSKG
jgi:hypothetical protein